VTRALLHGITTLLAVVIPLVVAELRPAFVGMSYGRSFLPFELLGLTGGAALAAIAVFEARRRRPHGPREWIALAVPCLLALHFLTLTSEYAQRRFDYDCYEYAGRALLAGESPYRVGLIYLYPPLTAQVFAQAHTAVAAASAWLGASADRDLVWDRVFYLYQCAQVLLVVAAYFLCLRYARTAGISGWWLPLLVGALVMFDNAVFRTLRHGQVNLWLLDLSLAGLLFARSRPAAAGAALAVAAHLKLYPLIALLPLLVSGRWRAAALAVAGFGALVLVSAGFGRDAWLWLEYLALLRQDFPGEIAFRNNSLHSLLYNLDVLWLGGSGRGPLVSLGVRAGAALFGAWFLVRLVRRERIRRAEDASAEARHFAGHVADALAFALLVSPSVWEHHYVMALPLAIHALATRGRERPVAVVACILAMLAMPTFDVFPLGHHRLAGMLGLLLLTPPRELASKGSRNAR
jgi:hypothetical protein